MKVARIYDFNDIRIEEMPIPEVGRREALVKVKACGICSGDVTAWYIKQKAPIVIGHEPAGIISAVGSEVEGFSVGDRVFVHHHAPCFICKHCRRGYYSMCKTWKASHIYPGGVAEYFLVPEINLRNDTLKLPASVSFEAASLIEPTACSIKALKRAGIKGGERVLQIGLGIMGQLNVVLARYYGAKQVIAADLRDDRCELAKKLGADTAINTAKTELRKAVEDITDGELADVVIVGPPKVEVMKLGIDCAGKGSCVVFFMGSAPGELLEVEPHHLYFNEITLVSSYSCGPYDTREALELISQKVIPADKLITDRFSIEETPQAFAKMASLNTLKAIIVF
ncbi:MAG: alcohol dehydrogenase catalytic domain-containing protein [Acidobacteriota bacterium]|nr:alcohol dehydrogenase catalytic domain-containing protein [Blastocatellia bacterium]MDW8411336.1 alcohol dehydrogenase catalytic domain-containing protein [Acidobacteriota bacterium]